MPASPSETMYEDDYADQPVSVSHFAHVLRNYAGIIGLALASVIFVSVVIGLAAYLLAPRQKVVSLPFRLEFSGGANGTYPNGLKFSVSDIVATPVLLEVYNANNLSRFTNFGSFSRSLYVVESNRALEQLTYEYEAKLSDPKLTPVDRDRIEREFEAKRASISKSDYSIEYQDGSQTSGMPTAVAQKGLADILAAWARRAAIEKKALQYQIAMVGPSILDNLKVTGNDYLIPLLILRQRVESVSSNATAVSDMPGAKLVRTRDAKTAIAEIQLRLAEIIRFRLEPLIVSSRAAGLFGPNALQIARAQLAYDQRMLTAAKAREVALENTLLTYESVQPQAALTTKTASASASKPQSVPERSSGETVMPQIADSFLDRIVDLTNRTADRDYRQKLADEIKDASLAVVPSEAAVKYDQELIDSFKTPPAGASTIGVADFKAQWDSTVAEVRRVIVDLNQIYTIASSQLYPETEMFRVTGPATTHIERTLRPSRLAMYIFLAFLVAIPLTLIAVLVHNRIREEEAAKKNG